MELKVWVEGIQRVVCGVSDVTTCQDVVIALAHATGKTGRFTLIERWRENERLIAPTECPLKVLRNWGEYAADVQLVLRHSGDRDKTRTAQANLSTTSGLARSPREGSGAIDDRLFNHRQHHQIVPNMDTVQMKGVVKRNLTFSGAHQSSAPLRPAARNAIPFENTSLDSVEEQSSISSHSSSSPYSSFQSSSTTETVRNKLPFGQFRPSEFSRLRGTIAEQVRIPESESSPVDTPTNSLERRTAAKNPYPNAEYYDISEQLGNHKVLSASMPISHHNKHLFLEDKLSPRASPNHYVPGTNFHKDSRALIQNSHLPNSDSNVPMHTRHIYHKSQNSSGLSKYSNEEIPKAIKSRTNLKQNHYELNSHDMDTQLYRASNGHELGPYNDHSLNELSRLSDTSAHVSQKHQHRLSQDLSNSTHQRIHLGHVDPSYPNAKHMVDDIGNDSNYHSQNNTQNSMKDKHRPKSPTNSYELALLDSSLEIDENKNNKKSLNLSDLLKGRGLENISRDELVKLVNLQIGRLNTQESQMKALDDDIAEWEVKDEDNVRQLKALADDLATLEHQRRDVSGQVEELELVSWTDKLQAEEQLESRLRGEIEEFQSQITSQADKLTSCREQCLNLERQIEEEKREIERATKELEIKILQEISELQKQINQKLVDHESNEHSIDDLSAEVKSLESAILERKGQVAEMEKDLKDINLELFNHSKEDGEEQEEEKEEPGGTLHRSSSSRPGSTRVMPTTPAQLKDAIQSEPQGYWV